MKIKFLKEHAFDGRTYEAGEVADIEEDTARALVQLDIAESQASRGDGAPAFDEERVAQIVNQATQNIIDQERQGAGEDRTVQLRPDEDDGETRVNGERVPGWRRRTVRWIQATILSASGDPQQRRRAEKMFAKLQRQAAAMSDAQYKEESKRAQEAINDTTLPYRSTKRTLQSFQVRRVKEIMSVVDDSRRVLQQEMRAGQSTLSGPEGEFLLPKPFLAELFVFIEEYGYARRLYRNIPMTNKSLDFKDIPTKPVAYWVGEGARIDTTEMLLGEGGMTASKMGAVSFWTNELDEDAAIAWLPTFTELAAEAMAEKEDISAFRGDGSQSTGGFVGLLNLSGVTTKTLGSGSTSVQDITIDEIKETPYAVSKARRRGGAWLLPETTILSLAKKKDNEGNYILRMPENDNQIARLAGYPIVDPEGVYDNLLYESDGADTVFGAFGDFGRALFGQRRGMSVETSTDAVLQDSSGDITANMFQEDRTAIRMTERIAFGYPQPDAFVVLKTAS